ncbi:MAG TPA: ABC transporter ATP-binding protein [Ktedonobacteraceae bacterium]|nr:ABC transporter ATP-binding protein [Ktedonobacteraceae bacterium]
MTTVGLPPVQSAQVAGTVQMSIENVSKVITSRFTKTVILDALSFSIVKGTLFSITGPSGSGKSTLLNILTGIDRASSGQVLFGGQVLQKMSENRLAKWRGRNVGIVFQSFQLLPTLTARENVLMALELGRVLPRRQWNARTEECLQLVGMEKYMKRLPSELSGGQQQRVAIARALVNNPPVLVADEPTGNLDSQNAQQVFTLLAELAHQGQTIIYVTHDRDLAQRSDAGIDLLDGQIVSRRNVSS